MESLDEVAEVVILNYAASIDVDILLVDTVDRDDILPIARQLQEWSENRASQALRETRRKITSRIKGIDFTQYEFATFFTTGLPYGLILDDVIPFTHMVNGPFTGICIANIISEEHQREPIGNALLFSIDQFAEDETEELQRQLDANNFLHTSLVGKKATNTNLSFFAAHLPYDVLHICSHGGETDGYFVKQPFADRDGNEHILEYFEVVSFGASPVGPDKVHVERKLIFTTLDGIPWADRPLKLYPRYVGDDMMHAMKDHDDRLRRRPTNVPIAMSAHIKCYESFSQGAFDSLASHSHPIVFNNSCSSSHELGVLFLAAGARSYISTLWNVGTTTAKDAALKFYGSLFTSAKVLDAFFAMLKSIKHPKYRNIYILWGLHFSSLLHPATKDDSNIITELFGGFDVWMRRFTNTEDEEIKTASFPIVQFIASEIARRVPPERLGQIAATLPLDPEIERSGAMASELDTGELIIATEQPRSKVPG
jgi:hypothetical protein